MLWIFVALGLALCVIPQFAANSSAPLSKLEERLAGEQPEVLEHGRRVASLVRPLLSRIPERITDIDTVAVLHDVGKLDVSTDILNKAGSLSVDEYESVKQHSVAGAQYFESYGWTAQAAWVRSHHEWFDGTGYPDGLAGNEIPLPSRLIAVADAFDAMTAECSVSRGYRSPICEEEALFELRRASGSQFDPNIVEAFVEVCLARER